MLSLHISNAFYVIGFSASALLLRTLVMRHLAALPAARTLR